MNSPANAIASFAFDDNLVRVIYLDGQPWWVATDLAKLLGYRDARDMVRKLDDDQKRLHLISSSGGQQEGWIVNESGLWMCVLKSHRAEAKRFQKWLTGDLLPALRRDGYYAMPGAVRTINLPTAARIRAMRQLNAATLALGKAETTAQRNLLYAQMQEMALLLDVPLEPLVAFSPESQLAEEAEATIDRAFELVKEGRVKDYHRIDDFIGVRRRDLEAAGIILRPALRDAVLRHKRCKGYGAINSEHDGFIHGFTFTPAA